jgi:excisionase family DNA binding protein
MKDNPEDRLLHTAEVAAQLSVRRNTVWNYCREGKLAHIRLSARNYRIRQRDLDSFLDARCR